MMIGQTRTKRKRKIWSSTMLLACTVIGVTAAHGDALAQAPAAVSPSVQVLYSPEKDTYFARPYVDVDEWRDLPVRHRYVHGGFKGTETRFSFYFPPREQYEGRFFQHITPVPDDENLAQKARLDENNKIAAAFEGGAYFVETNGGGKFDLGKVATMKYDPTISAYRANAACAAIRVGWHNGSTTRPIAHSATPTAAAEVRIGPSAPSRTLPAFGKASCPT